MEAIEHSLSSLGIGDATHQADRKAQILAWLSPYDAPASGQDARAQWKYDSGKTSWIFDTDEYRAWMAGTNQFLWLRGPRAMTTFISSKAVSEIDSSSRQQSVKTFVWAYIYFNYASNGPYSTKTVLRSILTQLVTPMKEIPMEVARLYDEFENRDASTSALLEVLRKIMSRGQRVYLIFDAFDSQTKDTEMMASLITDISRLVLNVSILATSGSTEQASPGSLSMLSSCTCTVDIDEKKIAHNLDVHFQRWLSNDGNKFEEVYQHVEKIRRTLLTDTEKPYYASVRRYHLLTLQMNALAASLRKGSLDKALSHLPATLEAAYDRILGAVDESLRTITSELLKWLAFSLRPITPAETIVLIASCDTSVSKEDTLNTYTHRIVPLLHDLGVFLIDPDSPRLNTCLETHLTNTTISGDQDFPRKSYTFTECDAHTEIAYRCLQYLLKFTEPNAVSLKVKDKHPLSEYSARFWYRHARIATQMAVDSTSSAKQLDEMSMQMFAEHNQIAFRNWLRISRPDSATKNPLHEDLSISFFYQQHLDNIGSQIYYAASCGLPAVVSKLIEQGQSAKTKAEHVDGCTYPGPLEVAVEKGFLDVAEILMEADARPSLWVESGGTCLLRACQNGDVAMANLVLEFGAKVTEHMSDGSTALHCASKVGSVELVKLLVEIGADVDARTSIGTTPLHEALFSQKDEAVLALLQMGADVEAATRKSMRTDRGGGLFDLWMVTNEQDYEACRETQDSTHRTPLYIAATQNNHKLVLALLEHGANVDTPTSTGATALHAVTSQGFVSITEILLQHGAQPRLRPHSQATLLHLAAESGKPEVVKMAAAFDIDLEALDDWNDTAITRAISRSNVATVQALYKLGCDLHRVKAPTNMTALHFGVVHGKTEMVTYLLEQGLSVHARNSQGGTPLHLAANGGHVKIIDMLLRRGANIDDVFLDNYTVLRAAVMGESAEAVETLLDRPQPANAEIKDDSGHSPLQIAVQQGNGTLTELLLKYGADPDSQNATGATALHYAADHQKDLVPTLLKYGARVDIDEVHGCNAIARPIYKVDFEMVEMLVKDQQDMEALCDALAVNGINGRALAADLDNVVNLTWALVSGHAVVTWMLLYYGSHTANSMIGVPNSSSTFPALIIVTQFGKIDVVKVLLKLGVDAETQAWALHVAVESNHPEIVEALLEGGCRVDGREGVQHTPLTTALKNRRDQMVRLLCKYGANLAVEEERLNLSVVIGPKQIFYGVRG